MDAMDERPQENTRDSAVQLASLLPLPAEIAQLSDGETACQYCGVSYLLLHKYEQMTRHVREMEAELQTMRDYVAERPRTLERLGDLQARLEASEAGRQGAAERAGATAAALLVEKTARARAESLCANAENQLASLVKPLKAVQTDAQALSASLQGARRDITQITSSSQAMIISAVKSVAERWSLCNQKHKDQLAICQNAHETQLAASTSRAAAAETRIENLEREKTMLQADVQRFESAQTAAQALLAQDREKLEAITNQLGTTQQNLRDAVAARDSAIRAADAAALAADAAAARASTAERSINDRDNGAQRALAQKEQALIALNKDVQALRAERAELVHAHQSRIQQLQEKNRRDTERAVDAAAAEQVAAVEERMQRQISSRDAEHERAVAALRLEIAKATERAAQTERARETACGELVAARATARAESAQTHRDHEQTLKAAQARETAALERCAALDARLAALNAAVGDRAAADARVVELERESADAAAQLQHLKETVKAQCEERIALLALIDSLRASAAPTAPAEPPEENRAFSAQAQAARREQLRKIQRGAARNG